MTQGGLLSTQEATYHGVPILGIPVGGDQLLNMKRSETAGVGLTLTWELLSPEAIADAMREILTNEDLYLENVRQRSLIMKDQLTSPRDRAAYWIEYVARHRGAPHLKASAATMTWYEYRNLDVWILVLCAVLILMSTPIVLVMTVVCWLCPRGHRKAIKRQKSD